MKEGNASRQVWRGPLPIMAQHTEMHDSKTKIYLNRMIVKCNQQRLLFKIWTQSKEVRRRVRN